MGGLDVAKLDFILWGHREELSDEPRGPPVNTSQPPQFSQAHNSSGFLHIPQIVSAHPQHVCTHTDPILKNITGNICIHFPASNTLTGSAFFIYRLASFKLMYSTPQKGCPIIWSPPCPVDGHLGCFTVFCYPKKLQ